VRVVIDLETCSLADLRRTGAQVYAEHPSTQVTVACYAVGDGQVKTWVPGMPPPADFAQAVAAGAVVVAQNYLFEFNVYHRKLVPLGWPAIPQSQWSCTMARAYVAGFPGGLEAASRAMRLAIPKDAKARDLMLRMARPRVVDPVTGIEWWHETSPDHYLRLQDYCRVDVQAERLMDKALPELSPREREIFNADCSINQRGLLIDQPLVVALRSVAATAKDRLTKELETITGGAVTSVNQVAKMKDWLRQRGFALIDLRKDTIAKWLRYHMLTADVRRVLEIRRDISRSSVAKLDAILAARSPRDMRVRGCFQYYGASRTGRWAGRRLQPQNLFRGTVAAELVPDVIRAVLAGAQPEDLELVYGQGTMSLVASCLRACIMAGPGRKLCIVDYAQIEARVVAWLAGQARALSVFRLGQDIYTETALAVGSSSRLLGKVLVLACGFGMGVERFQETARSFGLDLDLLTCAQLVGAWRAANREIVQFWYACNDALLRIARGHSTPITIGFVTFLRRGRSVLVRLPSGRHLVYRYAAVDSEGNFSYMGGVSGGGWTRLKSWPGKIVENITQAVARDVLADALVQLQKQNVPLVGQVHDELIAEPYEQDAPNTLAKMTAAMRKPLSWAPGLPLDAKGAISDRYVKA
jgi:DNA polymerase